MKVYICLAVIIFVLSFVLYWTIRMCIKTKKQYNEIKDAYIRLAKYKEVTDAKIQELHTGDTVNNALDILSKH